MCIVSKYQNNPKFQDLKKELSGREMVIVGQPSNPSGAMFDPLKIEPDVCLRIVRKDTQLGMPDAVILPGSKNVLGDLHYLRESGLASRIIELEKRGNTSIIGLCGGFQMVASLICRAMPQHWIDSLICVFGFAPNVLCIRRKI